MYLSLGFEFAHFRYLRVPVDTVPQYVYLTGMLGEGMRNRLIDAVAEDRYRINIRQNSAQEKVLLIAQPKIGLVALEMKGMQRNHLRFVQVPERLDESGVVPPDTEFVLKPEHLIPIGFKPL
jgi:hypothetical protein